MGKIIKKAVLVFVLLTACLTILGSAAFAAAPALNLQVTTVIDNIDEYPGLKNASFYYDAKRIIEMTSNNTYPALYPSNSTIKTFSWKHGQTAKVSWNKSNGSSNCDLLWFGANSKTDSHISLASVEYNANGNLKQYTYDDNGRAKAITSYNWLQVINSSKGEAKVTLHFRYNPDIDEVEPDPDPEPEYAKTIDYLGDGIPNPDTSANGLNDYRIYLDVTTEASETETDRDIIFVLDVSNSMDTALGNTTRFNVLKNTVKSAVNSLVQNPSNRISIITFGTRAQIVTTRETDRTKLINCVNSLSLPGGTAGGTNYYESMLHAAQIVNGSINGSHEKVIFFVSDGEPTASLPAANAMGYAAYAEVATIYAYHAAQEFQNVDRFYSVFIGDDSGSASTLQTITQMVEVNNEKYMVQASSAEQLTSAFNRFVSKVGNSLYDVTITDELSSYVSYAGDLKVSRKTGDAEAVTLTAGVDYSVTSVSDKLSIQLLKSTIPDSRYTLSFNVRASDESLDYYGQYESYPNIGDPNTDYEGNNTSSDKPGFYSNTLAELSYSFGGNGSAVKHYNKPVIQVVEANAVPAEIQLRKVLQGKDLVEGMFEFEIRQVIQGENQEETKTVPIATVKNDKDGFITFNSISFTKPGKYLYEVKEIIPDVPEQGMTYDTKTLTVVANVVRNSGDLDVKITYPNGTAFTNVYNPKPVSVNFEVKKKLTGRTLSANAFQFRLLNGNEDSIEVVSNTSDGRVVFSPIEFTKVGTYNFKVREIVPMPANSNIIYDTKTVPIVVNVADAGGYLTADVKYSNDTTFTNQFAYSPIKANIELKVVLSGMQLSTGMFKFELTDSNGKTYSAINQSDGKIRFPIDFTNVGTYTFVARQIIPSEPMRYMTYDKQNIRITVNVTDNGSGKLVANIQSSSDMTFYNSYKVRGGIW